MGADSWMQSRVQVAWVIGWAQCYRGGTLAIQRANQILLVLDSVQDWVQECAPKGLSQLAGVAGVNGWLRLCRVE